MRQEPGHVVCERVRARSGTPGGEHGHVSPGRLGGANHVVEEREGQVVDPLHVVDHEQRRAGLLQRPMRRLEDADRLDGLAGGGPECRVRRHRAQQLARGRERYEPLGLVAHDPEDVPRRPSLALGEQARLPGAGIAHEHERRGPFTLVKRADALELGRTPDQDPPHAFSLRRSCRMR